MTKVAELYGISTLRSADWSAIAAAQQCPFLSRKCLKNRKSDAKRTIGTCTMLYGKLASPVMICPFRLLERSQIFIDCIHLLSMHEPGNELRIIPELNVPGGSVDYCLVSVRNGKPKDFVGIELQTLDSTGTVWPERQRFIASHGVKTKKGDVTSGKPFGMNWKMTAKTILVQLHHKTTTFEHLSKHLVLVMQDALLEYMRREFSFGHINGVRNGDPVQFHAYELQVQSDEYRLNLRERVSTDGNGIAICLGLQGSARVELETIYQQIEAKLPDSTLLTLGGPTEAVPVPSSAAAEAEGPD